MNEAIKGFLFGLGSGILITLFIIRWEYAVWFAKVVNQAKDEQLHDDTVWVRKYPGSSPPPHNELVAK